VSTPNLFSTSTEMVCRIVCRNQKTRVPEERRATCLFSGSAPFLRAWHRRPRASARRQLLAGGTRALPGVFRYDQSVVRLSQLGQRSERPEALWPFASARNVT